MLKHFRYTAIFRCIAALMAVYLFNISADPADNGPVGVAENLSINKQESFLEIAIEKVFGYDDAIAEYDDNDCDEGFSIKKTLSIDFYLVPMAKPAPKKYILTFKKQPIIVLLQTHKDIMAEINSPPPEA
ncbi:hypothetical protein ACLI09_15315 [Flavobacterium sp. RHBU_24]|uniref:hypothetical protein n=1 Tax=Flavobacterium sp. RHBU_24 TaxID=3391185 RepID=UPI00398462C9